MRTGTTEEMMPDDRPKGRGATDRPPDPEPLKAKLRWMEWRDLPWVTALDALSYRPWGPALLKKQLETGEVKIRVAAADARVVGLLGVYQDKNHWQVLGLCVDPAYRRRGVAAALLAWLTGEKLDRRRPRATADVPETCLDVQLTLKKAGWRSDPHQPVVRALFDAPVEDAFQMVYELPAGAPARGDR